MNRHEIWFISIKISNLSKIKLIEKYNNELKANEVLASK